MRPEGGVVFTGRGATPRQSSSFRLRRGRLGRPRPASMVYAAWKQDGRGSVRFGSVCVFDSSRASLFARKSVCALRTNDCFARFARFAVRKCCG